MRTLIANGLLALENGLFPGSLLIDGERVGGIYINDNSAPKNEGPFQVIDAAGSIIAPGFIDLHCHGGAMSDVNDGKPESLERLGAFHQAHGVTAYTPSVSVDSIDVIERSLETIRSVQSSNRPGKIEILGAHFESPYINPRYKGCQAAERLLPFDQNALSLIQEFAPSIRRITVAPEMPGVLEAIPQLREWGLVVSLGHSAADAAVFRAAVDRGATMATHLFNAMSSVRKDGPFRVSGCVEAALTDDRVYTEVIGDGKHLTKELITIAWRCKGPDKFLLCSDANRGAGMSGGSTLFVCGQEAMVEDGVAMLKDRSSLASSVTPLDGMVRYLVGQVGIPPYLALRSASAVPAAAIGVADRKGRLSPGYDADLVLLDSDLRVQNVWCRGEASL